MTPKKRAMSSDQAREVRAKGHADARQFALLIGLPNDYKNDLKAKKDVIDHNGDAHSVKSGKAWWQIFLYSLNRIRSDYAFTAMNGVGQLIGECLNCFPQDRSDYLMDKARYKKALEIPMKQISDKLQDKKRLAAFLAKSFFNGNEVQFLTIKHNDKYHIFYYKNVIDTLCENFTITNSVAHQKDQFNNQKVLFKIDDKNAGELEVRTDSDVHYREIKFRLNKLKVLTLLQLKIASKDEPIKINGADVNNKLIRYGAAIKKFK
ncbi:MAG: hypothetical protein LBP89_07940 [Helicobacteraceae bacterium]|jgi:hypothetical protein|nr:hypothetical protein [Helicobacteraceae bacterium]